MVCLPARQAALILDSLQMLNMVRNEAGAWQTAAAAYRRAADSANVAKERWRAAYQNAAVAYDGQTVLLANQANETARWKGRARRRGLLNYLFIAAAGGLTFLFVKP